MVTWKYPSEHDGKGDRMPGSTEQRNLRKKVLGGGCVQELGVVLTGGPGGGGRERPCLSGWEQCAHRHYGTMKGEGGRSEAEGVCRSRPRRTSDSC
jgi:hypothetical protein